MAPDLPTSDPLRDLALAGKSLNAAIGRIAALESALKAKEAECETVKADAERLDHLDRHGRDVVFGIGYGSSADAWCVRTASIGFVQCENLRAAIDTSRKEGK